ncbi:hypothetical protein MSG28_001324 [Choristoneura fumiferana]|uniref:Uncharacterized protein n=1 Tax=Choristoneura fumiferana TaxID=7141 RepID=A0ACC0KU73_CHOFU|nr:hypothetical protein MSG28_001324 [Choristoneura fumiferana]
MLARKERESGIGKPDARHGETKVSIRPEVNKGHLDADHKGYNGKTGHEEHHEKHSEHGKKGGKEGGAQWSHGKKN